MEIKLTESQLALLGTLAGTAQWTALLDLMEQLVAQAEEEHLLTYRDAELFQRTGLIAVAMKIFAGRVEAQVTLSGQAATDKVKAETAAKKIKEFADLRDWRKVADTISDYGLPQ